MSEARYVDERQVYKIEDGEIHHVVAKSTEEAIEQHAVEFLGYASSAEYLADMGPIDCNLVEPGKEIVLMDDEGSIDAKLAWEWATMKQGVFCTSSD